MKDFGGTLDEVRAFGSRPFPLSSFSRFSLFHLPEFGLNPAMRLSAGLLAMLLLGSCADQPETLVVKQHLLRDQTRDSDEEPMVRMEKERRLRGAISMEERRQRLGQYYTILWSDPKGKGQGPVEVVFEYRQGASGSRIKRMTQSFPAHEVQGSASFAVAGDDYFKNGRVLAWQAKVFRGRAELASKRSYLWD